MVIKEEYNATAGGIEEMAAYLPPFLQKAALNTALSKVVSCFAAKGLASPHQNRKRIHGLVIV